MRCMLNISEVADMASCKLSKLNVASRRTHSLHNIWLAVRPDEESSFFAMQRRSPSVHRKVRREEGARRQRRSDTLEVQYKPASQLSYVKGAAWWPACT